MSEEGTLVAKKNGERGSVDVESADPLVENPGALTLITFGPSIACEEVAKVCCPRITGPDPKLRKWDPEDDVFWNREGAAIASRNLWTSVPQLLMGFAVWLIWSVICGKIQLVHDDDPDVYKFESWGSPKGKEYKNMLYLLPAVAGLSGGTLRIPNSFMVAIAGGRNVVSMSTLMLMPSMIMASIGLSNSDVDFSILVIAAALSGVGGGAFASSMSNISFFYPKRLQGYALGINGGIGNLGVSLSQLFCPLMMTYAAFGGSAINTKGKPTWVQNGPLFWIPFLVIGLFASWVLMSNMPKHGSKSTTENLNKYFRLELPALGASTLAVLTLFATRKEKWATETEGGAIGRIALLVLIAASAEHVFMYVFSPPEVKAKLRTQFIIFNDKHTYIMTVIYTMCFGSFIGYSGAFPKLIIDIFGYLKNGDKNPNAPDALSFAWMGPFVGSIARPMGGIAADRFGGAVCTQICIAGCILFAIVAATLCISAREADAPEDFFGAFLFSFIMLFFFTGTMNGTTFRSISLIFPPEKAGPVLGWSSAMASYGAFIIPALFGLGIKANKVENVMFGLMGFYILCGCMNFWWYARPGAEKPC